MDYNYHPIQAKNLPLAARWTLASVFVTNIGNGMYTLTIAKLLYDKTGSAAAFAIVLIVEYVCNFLVQPLAGSLVDRGKPKQISVICDIGRGLFICLASWVISVQHAFVSLWVIASIIVIYIATPFYRSATFTIGPAIAQGDHLARYNALSNSLLQAGQFLGIALVGPVIQYYGAALSFGFDGLSFLIAGILVWVAQIPFIEPKKDKIKQRWGAGFLHDWQEIYVLLRSQPSLAFHLLLCSADFLAVSGLNLALVPMVAQWFHGNAYFLSVFDGSFALGSIAASVFSFHVTKKLGPIKAVILCLGGEALCFMLISMMRTPYLLVIPIFSLGILTTISISTFMSNLQRRLIGPVKGRISGVRFFILALLGCLFLPTISAMQNLSISAGLLVTAFMSLLFLFGTFILSRPRVYGKSLLGIQVTGE